MHSQARPEQRRPCDSLMLSNGGMRRSRCSAVETSTSFCNGCIPKRARSNVEPAIFVCYPTTELHVKLISHVSPRAYQKHIQALEPKEKCDKPLLFARLARGIFACEGLEWYPVQ
jgi:hypothetical protein